MAKTRFEHGTIVTPEFLNKIFNHRHNGGDEDGSVRHVIIDTETSGVLSGDRVGDHLHDGTKHSKIRLEQDVSGVLPASHLPPQSLPNVSLAAWKFFDLHGVRIAEEGWRDGSATLGALVLHVPSVTKVLLTHASYYLSNGVLGTVKLWAGYAVGNTNLFTFDIPVVHGAPGKGSVTYAMDEAPVVCESMAATTVLITARLDPMDIPANMEGNSFMTCFARFLLSQ
jgi:hypothetical protein